MGEDAYVGLTSSPSTLAALQGRIYLLQGLTPDEQVREVCMVFGIDWRKRMEFAMDRRCCLCNGAIRVVSREEVAKKVPWRALEAFDRFFMCSQDRCDTVFWNGQSYFAG